jgi:uncharacterized protein
VRLIPDEPLPPYAYVPGRFPHPETHPAGHSFHIRRPKPPPLLPEQWPRSRAYLRGLDLFNGHYYWESHVEFEGLWLACGRRGDVATFLKGLIKVAAAGVKHLEGRPGRIKSLAGRATEHWREVALGRAHGQDLFLGFRLPALIELAGAMSEEGWPNPSPILRPAFSGPAS